MTRVGEAMTMESFSGLSRESLLPRRGDRLSVPLLVQPGFSGQARE